MKNAITAALAIAAGAIIALFALVAITASTALATWKPEYASAPKEVQDWYANAQLTEPAQKRMAFVYCCKSSEVVHTKFKVNRRDGTDEWFYLKDGNYERIPPDIIHWGESAPGGQPTLFTLETPLFGLPAGTPTCFWPGDGGI